jgi:ribose 5-phosphate isomerase B
MRIGIATDHGGFDLKEELVAQLRAAGHEIVDFGANILSPDDDYPDFVTPLAHAVAAGEVKRGVAICGSGVGASVCANKIPGVRAALIHDHFSARQGVEDDHMNIICMGGRTVGPGGLGTWSRPSWPPSSVGPNDICAGWVRWRPWKQSGARNEWGCRRYKRPSFVVGALTPLF